MRRFPHICRAILAVLFFLSGPSAYASCALIADASGSMQGFKSSEAEKSGSLVNFVDELKETCGRAWRFGGDRSGYHNLREFYGSFGDENLSEDRTLIGPALLDWLSLSKNKDVETVYLVTDNVSDVGSATNQRIQQQFYDLLVEQRFFDNQTMLPVRFPFKDGLVYNPRNNAISNNYTGPRAVVVYVLSRRSDIEDHKDSVETVTNLLDAYNAPYVRQDIRPFLQSNQVTLPNTETKVSADGMSAKYENGKIIIKGRRLDTNDELSIDLFITSPPNWNIVEAEFKPQLKFDMKGFEELDDMDFSSPSISPERSPLEDGTPRAFKIKFKMNPVDYGKDVPFLEKVKAAPRPTKILKGAFTVDWVFERDEIEISDTSELRMDWAYEGNYADLSKPDPNVQGRIFMLDRLVRDSLPKQELNAPINIPVEMEVVYPKTYTYVLYLILILLLGLLLTLLYFLGKPRAYDISAGSSQTKTRQMGFNFSPYTANHASGKAKLKMLHLGAIIWLSTPKGRIDGSRIWSGAGGRVKIVHGGVSKTTPLMGKLKGVSIADLIAQVKMSPAEKRRQKRRGRAADIATEAPKNGQAEPSMAASMPYTFRVTRQQDEKKKTGGRARRSASRRRPGRR